MTGSLVAVISGGTRGIGLAFGERLIELGYHVVALYRDDATAAEEATERLGPRMHARRCDVTDAERVQAVVEDVITGIGAPRVLVNNAGINVDKPFLDMSADDFRRVVDVNLTGAFVLTKAVVPHMDRGADPVIVNVGATTGIRPRLNGVNYCASKAGLLQMTKCLALELAPHIRVNCLIPGMTETEELIDRFNLRDPAARERALAEIPQHRLGSVGDITHALEFLIGPSASYVNGQKLIVDGGQFMW
jgi:3-oxoacyl-[acyl-carrier protein] reductase